MSKPRLKNIRMPLENDDKRLSSKKQYLAKLDGKWHTGYFSKQWYGWLFNYSVTNMQISSKGAHGMDNRWKKLYEIK